MQPAVEGDLDAIRIIGRKAAAAVPIDLALAIQFANNAGKIHIRLEHGACLARSFEDERAERGQASSIFGAQDAPGQFGLTRISVIRPENHEPALDFHAGARGTIGGNGEILALGVVRDAQRAFLASEFDRVVASRVKCVGVEDESRVRHHEDIGAGEIATLAAVPAAAAHGVVIFKKRIALEGHGATCANEDRAASGRPAPTTEGSELASRIARPARVRTTAADTTAEPLIAARAPAPLTGARSTISTRAATRAKAAGAASTPSAAHPVTGPAAAGSADSAITTSATAVKIASLPPLTA